MKTYGKFYFISMQVIATILAIIYSILPFFLFFYYLLPTFKLLKEGASTNTFVGAFIFIISLIIIFAIIVAIFLILAVLTFKEARKFSKQKLVEERRTLFGYGIFTAITFAPTIFGLIIMLIFIIYTNDCILEVQKEYDLPKKNKVKVSEKRLSLDNKIETLMAQLESLKELKEDGLITEEEYIKKRRDLLDM